MIGLYVLIGIFVLFSVVHLLVYRGHSVPTGEYYTGGGLDTTAPPDSTGGVGDGSAGWN